MEVSIIGAGLSGLTLALALHEQGIPAVVYESRPAPLAIGGAVMLSPNALRVLDNLGLYSIVKDKGYNFDILEYKNVDGDILDVQEFGSQEKYGYRGLRIYRHVLIDTLVETLQSKGVEVRYGHAFSHVVEETDQGVTFAFKDGTTVSSTILVGADGIHSTVRRYIYPELGTKFIGMAGITAAVPTSQLKLPEGYHLPTTIMSPKGAFQRVAEGSHANWEREFVADKEAGLKFLQEGNDHFPEFVRNAVSHISLDKVNKWPFFVVPRLEKWASASLKVIIVGDAAHAIPPSAGQGINQAFEDVYMLALLVRQSKTAEESKAALSFWQTYRQERVDKILELNKQIDLRRMPNPGNEAGGQTDKLPFELGWLYEPDFKGIVDEYVNKSKN
ncbi:unnamed protein product [Parascedosporium putredinis]|uniref:FAD-binding domain-containing protein n=1 Tax=Parascedosporium putredinis TaxID=1442378 RepID=A0A9P1GZ75_9PEZI|nr:unnamed protein product [Parascedosporium putredinis]CAI7990787.1 unnamed protein product [Parascedosporium putredinis]